MAEIDCINAKEKTHVKWIAKMYKVKVTAETDNRNGKVKVICVMDNRNG